MASAICNSTNHLLNLLRSRIIPQVSSNPSMVLQISKATSLSAKNIACRNVRKTPPPLRASTEGVPIPTELIEDSKFVPLNADDATYGPPALLLLGFEVEEEVKLRQLLNDIDGEFLEVIFCTEDMIPSSLWEAMHTKQPSLEAVKIAQSLPRICFLSGLSGEEMMMIIDAFPETGLEPPAFAALVPNSADKPLQELIEEVMGDHEMLTGEQSKPM
ncbi:hypothetical protein Ddye_028874 [Dipteronia dyeriana]|uniref:Uncharacterized protein n=1 Tax=Dipteronia dyeriana TaxID=168575 RepID=A0AAD9WKZ2_9ROSI|nr:hypothetical protein Ddye_028874 [Dipteronia dyeriana]